MKGHTQEKIYAEQSMPTRRDYSLNSMEQELLWSQKQKEGWTHGWIKGWNFACMPLFYDSFRDVKSSCLAQQWGNNFNHAKKKVKLADLGENCVALSIHEHT